MQRGQQIAAVTWSARGTRLSQCPAGLRLRRWRVSEAGKSQFIVDLFRSGRESIRGFAIRYGQPGALLFEYRATLRKKIKAYVAQTGPGMARDVLSWSVGSGTYCITIGAGLEHGVDFFSVNEHRVVTSYGGSGEYERGSVEIDFHRRMSPIFARQRPSCNH